MCGIAGIVSSSDISKRLLQSITSLEYRGYDSCGMATHSKGCIEVRKNIGTVESVNSKEKFSQMSGSVGIAHTRWATHGDVSKRNAHPHTDSKNHLALVHNGIISNYNELRETLMKDGICFHSDTDSEVIAHMIASMQEKEGLDLEASFVKVLSEIEGSFAIAVISINVPGTILCAKQGSPLSIGLGEGTNFVGSDFNAFLPFTQSCIILDDGEYALVNERECIVKETSTCNPINKKVTEIPWEATMSDRGSFSHYMLKEIYDQPSTIKTALEIPRKELLNFANFIDSSSDCFIAGVGTTFYVASLGQYFFNDLADFFMPAISTDEFVHLVKPRPKSSLIVISQSGETFDTLNAVEYAKKNNVKTAGIVNVIGSTLVRTVDHCIMQGAGPEVSVISTKAALSQSVILFLISLELSLLKKKIDEKRVKEIRTQVLCIADLISEILDERSGFFHSFTQKHLEMRNWIFVGRGIYYPIALECALKMKEVTYLHAEGMSAGFLKHGTISLIDENVNTVVLIPPKEQEDLYNLTLNSVQEIRARGGFVLGIRFFDNNFPKDLLSDEIILPSVSTFQAPFLHLLSGQLLSYYMAVGLKRNVDRPRSLAKSVTVA